MSGVRQLADGLDVDQLEQRVGRGFEPHHPGALGQRFLDRLEIGAVDEGKRQTHGLEHAVEQAVGATIKIIDRDGVVARFEQPHDGGFGRHPRGERQAVAPTFQ